MFFSYETQLKVIIERVQEYEANTKTCQRKNAKNDSKINRDTKKAV